MKAYNYLTIIGLGLTFILSGCQTKSNNSNGALSANAADKVYIAPGEHDEFYAFISGGVQRPIIRLRTSFRKVVQGNSGFFSGR